MSKSFTMIELMIVIIIIGILASMAIPRFIEYNRDAEEAVEAQIVGRVKVGLNTYYIEAIINNQTDLYPSELDSAPNGPASASNPLFSNVLTPGITDSNWLKNGNEYTGPSTTVYEYEGSTTGRFIEKP